MSVSGSVRINTRLDNSQLMKDCRALKTVVTEVANAVKRAFHGREIQALEQQMEATREAMSPIVQELTEIENRASAAGKNSARDFQKAQAEAGKLQQQYDALLNKISEYEAKARAPFDAQLVTYKPTQTDLANNAAVEQQYAAAMASDQVYQKMIADAEQLRAKQYQVNQTVQQMKQAADDAGGTSSARYTELQGELEALRGRTQALNDQMRNLGVTGNNTGGMIASAIGGAASRAFSTLQKGARSVLKTFGTLVKSGIGKITSGLAQSGKGLQPFLNRLGSIAAGALVFNVISSGLSKMTQYMGKALLSSASLRTALGNLSGAAQTAAAPLFQVLTPALTALANAAATVFSYIAQLVTFLTGTTVSAASDAAAGVAGVGSAAEETAQQVKDANKSIAGFDELERLNEPQQDTGSGGGGGAGASQIVPNYDFQGKSPFLDSVLDAIKAGDWYQVGELVAQKLNESMAAIDWGPIDATAIRWATNLYTGLNGFVQNLNWGLLGNTIGNGLNTALHFIDTFFQGFDWDMLGRGLGTGLSSLVATVDWAALGRVLTDKLKALLETLHGFVVTFDFSALGQALATTTMAAFNNIDWAQAAGDASGFVIGVLQMLTGWVQGIDWAQLGATVAECLKAIDWAGLLISVLDFVGSVLLGLGEMVAGFFRELAQGGVDGFIEGILSFFKEIGAWVKEHMIDPLVNAVKDLLGIHSPSTVFSDIGKNLVMGLLNGISGIWNTISDFFATSLNVIQSRFSAAWNSIQAAAGNAFNGIRNTVLGIWNGVTSSFQNSLQSLQTGFTNTWNAVKNSVSGTFHSIQDTAASIWNRIVSTVRGAVNSILGFINRMISGIANGLNGAIDALNSLSFGVPDWLGGGHFGFSIGHITAPQIPYLAQGAVIPPNKEFLAVLGDQNHGTNIEAPLATIQQAVADVMRDNLDGEIAELEAIRSTLMDILEAVYGIDLSKNAVGRAVDCYQTQQAIITGRGR